MPEKQAEIPKTKYEETYKFMTYVVMRNYDNKIFAAKIFSDVPLSGENTKPADMKSALRFGNAGGKPVAVSYYNCDKPWDAAQKLEPKDMAKITSNKPVIFGGLNTAIALYDIKSRKGEDVVVPSYAAIGDSIITNPLKAIPKRRNRS